jgi:Na+-transporting NADH:ubiquinone oxidoreductase subunit NqrC
MRRPIERHVSNGSVAHKVSMRLRVAVESECVADLFVAERTENGRVVAVSKICSIQTTLVNLIFNMMTAELWVVVSVNVAFEIMRNNTVNGTTY